MVNTETSKEMAGDCDRPLGLLLESKMMMMMMMMMMMIIIIIIIIIMTKVICVTQQAVFHLKFLMEKLPIN